MKKSGRNSMEETRPVVIKIGETFVNPDALREVMKQIGVTPQSVEKFTKTRGQGAETLIEFAGRICYESYEPGLNPNVTKIRESPESYFANVLSRGDGSLLEHGWVSFALVGISRVTSHEIVRHRVGTAISQESLRYVRPREIKFWIPDELSGDQIQLMREAVDRAEDAYRRLEEGVAWDKLSMDSKKRLTSAFRRILPDGLATNMIWSANHRTLRWVIEMRTDPSAEVEIRMVFNQIADICRKDYPNLYSDFTSTELPDGTRSFRPTLRSKV
jgi:thymidylate synthase (FAD)